MHRKTWLKTDRREPWVVDKDLEFTQQALEMKLIIVTLASLWSFGLLGSESVPPTTWLPCWTDLRRAPHGP